jgi:hypothetical protein
MGAAVLTRVCGGVRRRGVERARRRGSPLQGSHHPRRRGGGGTYCVRPLCNPVRVQSAKRLGTEPMNVNPKPYTPNPTP